MNAKKICEPGDRYDLQECIDYGVFGKLYAAIDTESKKKVAVKVQKLSEETWKYIETEYKILKDFSEHPNLVNFLGVYRKANEIWLVLELCEGGPIIDLVNQLIKKNRRLSEEHIGYILKETVKALIHLHQNNIIHRDVKARNILLTKEGDIKLADFGLSRCLKNNLDQTGTTIGSPCWMAPEVVSANNEMPYGNRADVWALGITAIELSDGKAPLQDMHPTRVLFQIVRNPPPTLYRPSNWSQSLNDFINECLVKNPEHRPYMMEVIDHPFLEEIPANSFHLSLELKSILNDMGRIESGKSQDCNVFGHKLKKSINEAMEDMNVEDLAALDKINENIVLKQLETRMQKGQFQTFIGDVLLVMNPNEKLNIYGPKFHEKYSIKSRSENAPHIYAIADNAYQSALHHASPQQIILTGESASGKTKNFLHLMDHLIHLGYTSNINTGRIIKAVNFIHALTHASTPFNKYSTRCIMKTELSYSGAGKITGGSFKVEFLEKWRISSVDMSEGNFHMLYYLLDGLKDSNKLQQYHLDYDINYRYLRLSNETEEDIDKNIDKFKKLLTYMEEFDFSKEQIDTVLSCLSAILLLGEVRFSQTEDNMAVLENEETAKKVAGLLKIDPKKFTWALRNYCLQKSRAVLRKKNTSEEARDSRDVLANTLYQRLVDYIVEVINQKLYIGKAIFGEKFTIGLLDYFGFECFKLNNLPQFYINCLNEQFQYHYLQRLFSWEILDTKGEDVEYQTINFYNNKSTLDQLLQKPTGIITTIDQASKMGFEGKYIIEYIEKKSLNKISVKSKREFSVAHYTGRVTYDVREMPYKNRDFLSPEIIETLRLSDNAIVKQLFSCKLDKTGNLIVAQENERPKGKYSFLSSHSEKRQCDYSQIRRMRTASAIFRSISLNLIKEMSSNTGTHFVRCVCSNLKGVPNVFQKEIVRQQIRAMAVVETAKARQNGYTCRISFSEFLRRYKFLAFEFGENVDVNKENCRLLLIRLNLEGWAIGKSKVFLKYYNEEYLSRMYELQVRKIIKVQSIMRGFLVKCKLSKKEKEEGKKKIFNAARRMSQMTEEEAAAVIQQAYRKVKGHTDNLQEYKPLDAETINFITPYALRWKNKSIFQVLMQYRAAKIQDLFNFSQQVHFFNLNAYHFSQSLNNPVDAEDIDSKAQVLEWLGDIKPGVWKLNFHLDDIPYYDTSYMCDGLTNSGVSAEKEESWDSPYRNRELVLAKPEEIIENVLLKDSNENSDQLINLPYNRDPDEDLKCLPEYVEEVEEIKNPGTKAGKNVLNLAQKLDDKTHDKVNELNRVNLRKVGDFKTIEEKPITNSHTQPANKDFEYIRATPVANKPKYDPINELKDIGRKSSTSSDDPPFNFQGMLRKTNFQRDNSVKVKIIEGVRRFSLKKSEPIVVNNNGIVNESTEFKHITEELVPGFVIEGYEIEL